MLALTVICFGRELIEIIQEMDVRKIITCAGHHERQSILLCIVLAAE